MLAICSFFLFITHANAGEIEYTGIAIINNNDLKSAQNNSLKNALIGGINKYIKDNAPERKADITEDYFMFLESYEIVSRKIDGNRINTTVRMLINDLIKEDVAVYATKQVNTAVFLISGLPEYVNESHASQVLSDVFASKQFTTTEQTAFEQGLIDRKNRSDVQTAFQSASASQYLFEFNFNVVNYKAGESCTVQSDSSYMSASNLGKSIPVLRTVVTVESEDAEQCILNAVQSSVDTALIQVREKLIPSPIQQRELHKIQLVIKGITGLRIANNIMDTLNKRKMLVSTNMDGFYGNEAVFTVECYFTPEELANQIHKIGLESVSEIGYSDTGVHLTVK